MIDAILFADHHGGGNWPSRGIVGDDEFAMQQIVALALEMEADWLISLGDTLHRQRNRSAAVVAFLNALGPLRETTTDFAFIQGNHDFDEPPWLSVPGTVHLDGKSLTLGGRVFYGLDYRPREALAEALTKLPGHVSGLLAHQSWAELMGDITAPQGELAAMPEQIRCVISGDYHDECVFLRTFRGAAGQELAFCNPGATSMQRITEPADKFVLSLAEDGSFTRHRLKSRLVRRWGPLQSESELEEFLATWPMLLGAMLQKAADDGLPERLHKPLVHVSCSRLVAGARRRVEQRVGGDAHLFWKDLSKVEEPESTTVAAPARLAHTGVAVTLADVLSQEIRVDDIDDPLAPAAFPLAASLLDKHTKDEIEIALNRWHAEYLAAGETPP